MKEAFVYLLIAFLILQSIPLSSSQNSIKTPEGIYLSGFDVKVIKDSDYILSGNIILTDNATLYISYSNVKIYEDYDYQYRIILRGNSTLKILYSTISLPRVRIIVENNSKIYIENSRIMGNATLTFTAKEINVKQSILHLNNIMISGFMDFENSTINTKAFIINSSKIKMYNTSADSKIDITNSTGKIYGNPHIISADANSYITYNSLLHLKIHDLSKEYVEGSIAFRFSDNKTLYVVTKTNSSGELKIYLPTAIISNITRYIGNYNVTLYTPFKSYYKNIALQIGKNNIIDWNISEVIYPEINKSSYVFLENKRVEMIGSYSSFFLNNSIYLNNSILIVKNYSFLNDHKNIYALNSTLILEDAIIKLPIYAINSKIIVNRSYVKKIITVSGNISMKDIRSDFVYLNSNNFVLIGNAQMCYVSGNGKLEGDFGDISGSGQFIFSNLTADKISLFNSNVSLINSTYGALMAKQSNISIYYWIVFEVRNGNNRLVNGAYIQIYRHDIDSDHFIKKIPAKNGIVITPLLSSTGDRYLNYHVFATYKGYESNSVYFTVMNNSRYLLKFSGVHLVPPFNITVSYSFEPKSPHVNQNIFIEGKVSYDTGMPAVNTTVRIEIFNEEYFIRTDENGMFKINIKAPESPGSYSFLITVQNKTYNLTSRIYGEIYVNPPPTDWLYISAIGAVVMILVAVALIVVRRRKYYMVVSP